MVQYDFAPWEVENGDIVSVEWSILSGQAGITNETLAASKATANIATPQYGRSTIEIKATSATGLIMVTTLRVTAKDTYDHIHSDYAGWHH